MITEQWLKDNGVPEDKQEQALKDFGVYETGITDKHTTDKADAQSSMMNGQDKVIFEATGVEKLPNEWTSKYAVRAGGLSKQKEFDTYKNTTSIKIEGLDKQISDGFSKADEKLKEQNNSLVTKLDSERESWKIKELELNTKHDNYLADQALLSEMPIFKSDIDKGYAEFLKKNLLQDIKENYDVKTDTDRDTILVTKEGVQFAQHKLKDFYKEKLKDHIEIKNIQNGTGSQGSGSGAGASDHGILDSDTPQQKSDKIRQSLAKQGYNNMHAEFEKRFDDEYNKYVLKK